MPIQSLKQLDVQHGVYTYADYLTWKFEETVELIKGKILPMAAPSRRHQKISWKLTIEFDRQFSNAPCEAYAAPFDVRLINKTKSSKANKEVHTVVQPDICLVCDLEKLDEKGCLGAPDLIVEILSAGNSSKEMKIKKQLYEENEIREYWIFDPERETVHQFVLEANGLFSAPKIYVFDEVLECAIFPEFKIELQKVFAKR